jgi:urease accessory protein
MAASLSSNVPRIKHGPSTTNLRLLQLGDSALPIGGYSHSWGLEAAIDCDEVRDAPTLERWVRLWLRHSFGPCEGVVVGVVCRAAAAGNWPVVAAANDLLETGIVPTALRLASREMGEQLLSLSEAWTWAAHLRPTGAWHHAVVFATLAAAAGAAAIDALLVYLHQAVLGVISAGVRAVPIGHTHGQQVLSRLHDDIRDLSAELVGRDLDTAGSFCPAYEVLCHAQTHLYTRLFRS